MCESFKNDLKNDDYLNRKKTEIKVKNDPVFDYCEAFLVKGVSEKVRKMNEKLNQKSKFKNLGTYKDYVAFRKAASQDYDIIGFGGILPAETEFYKSKRNPTDCFKVIVGQQGAVRIDISQEEFEIKAKKKPLLPLAGPII